MIEMQRRSFLRGLGCIIAAPAIVSVANIMPVRSIEHFDMGGAIALLQQRLDTREALSDRQYVFAYGHEPGARFIRYGGYDVLPDLTPKVDVPVDAYWLNGGTFRARLRAC